MASLLLARTITFDIDKDMDSVLNNLSDEDLGGFAETHETLASFDEVKLHIYANVLIFRRTGLVEPLEQAMTRAKRWIEQTPETHPERALQLRILVQILAEMSRHKLASTTQVTTTDMGLVDESIVNDIEYAITVANVALDATPRGHPDRAAILNDLSAWHGMQFTATSQVEYLHYAVEAGTEAIRVTPRDHPYRHIILTNLGSWLCMQYQRKRSSRDIKHAIILAREALSLTPEGHDDRLMMLTTLGSRLHIRFKDTESVAVLDDAIAVEKGALDIMPQNHPERLNTLMNLGAWLGTRFERNGSDDDLNKAIYFARLALDLMPDNHHARSNADRNLQFLLSMKLDLFDLDLSHGPVIDSDAELSTFGPGGQVATLTEQTDTRYVLESSLPLHQVDRGADVNAVTNDGEMTSDMADAEGHVEVVEELVEPGALLTPSPEYGPVASEDSAHTGKLHSDSVGKHVEFECKAFRNISTVLSNNIPDPRRYNLTFSMRWELPDFVATELDGNWDIGSVLTVNGTVEEPFATTCEDYVKKFWPAWGFEAVKLTMQSVKKVLENASLKEPKNNISLGENLQLCHVYPETGQLNFEVSGTRDDLVHFAQLLAWLSAIFRKPRQDTVSRSSVEITRRVSEDEAGSSNTTAATTSRKLAFDINLIPLQEIGSSGGGCCWQPMFKNTVIADDFPVPKRNGEVGLELPFRAMTALSCVLYPLQTPNGILFKGYSTALVPKSQSIPGSIQWHFVQSSDSGEPLDVEDLLCHFGRSVELLTIDNLVKERAFLGYNEDVCVITGTQQSSYELMADLSGAEASSGTWALGRDFSPTVGFSNIATLGFRTEIAYARSLFAGVKAEENRTDDRLLNSRKRPLIMYDVQRKNAFMIPELCAILEIAHIWANAQDDREDILPKMPFSEPRSDGGQASYEAISRLKSQLLRDAYAGEPQIWLMSLLKDIFNALQERLDAHRISKDKYIAKAEFPGIKGWELSDIAAFRDSRQKRVRVGSHRDLFSASNKWYDIPAQNPDIIVLFYTGLAPPIRPMNENQACRTWTPLPKGCLLATVECLRYLSRSNCGTDDKPRLGKKLFWSKPVRGKIFELCDKRPYEGCQRLQLLVKHAPEMPLPDRPAGAIIFGDAESYNNCRCPTAVTFQNGDSSALAETENVPESHANWERRQPGGRIANNNSQGDHNMSGSEYDSPASEESNEIGHTGHTSWTDQGTEPTAIPIQIPTGQPTL